MHRAASSTSSSSSSSRHRRVKVATDVGSKFFGDCKYVEQFEKLDRLGEGTYGTVHRARFRETGEIFALKKIKMRGEVEGVPMTTLREITLLRRLQHENIVSLKEVVVGAKLSSMFLAFEYCEHDLAELLDTMSQPFSLPCVKCLMVQLLRAVDYLHQHWVLHRDIKMSNLLYTASGTLKLADFGLARKFSMPVRSLTPKVVTLWYRAPEILLGAKTYTESSDVWSCGCIMGELLLHKPLFPGKDDMGQINMLFSTLGTPTESEWPGVSELPVMQKKNHTFQSENYLSSTFSSLSREGLDLLQRMLTYDPERRITAREALQHAFFSERPLPQEPLLMPTFPSQSERRRRHKRQPSPRSPEKRRKVSSSIGPSSSSSLPSHHHHHHHHHQKPGL